MIDIHSGTSIYFCKEFAIYAGGLKASQKAEQLALHTGAPYIVQEKIYKNSELTMFMYATENGVPGIMISSGGHRRVENAFWRPIVNQCKNIMRFLGMLPETIFPAKKETIFQGIEFIPCSVGGIIINSVNLGDWVKKGQILARLFDVFGELVEEIVCPVEHALVIEHASGLLMPGEGAIELLLRDHS